MNQSKRKNEIRVDRASCGYFYEEFICSLQSWDVCLHDELIRIPIRLNKLIEILKFMANKLLDWDNRLATRCTSNRIKRQENFLRVGLSFNDVAVIFAYIIVNADLRLRAVNNA
jgi:hypothetical protein